MTWSTRNLTLLSEPILALACSTDPDPAHLPREPRTGAPLASVTSEPEVQATAIPSPPRNDTARCKRIREVVEVATDLGALRTSLTGAVPPLGLVTGESLMAGRELVSFCVKVGPSLSPHSCLATLGFDRPFAVRMSPKDDANWQVHQSVPQPGKPFATRAPRYGPAAVIPMIAGPPQGRAEPEAPEGLPFFSLDQDRDAIVELCFVQRPIGEQ